MKNILFLSLIFVFISCSYTRNINLSKKEIQKLEVIYREKKNHYVYDTEWVFYEKNICQLSTFLIRKKTYTGTWIQKNDTIIASFFYKKNEIYETWKFIVDKNGKIKALP